jgi:multiple sugar transport system permease protein
VAAVAILAFWLYWGDFLGPLLYLKSERLYTLPIGVRQLQQMARSNWPLLLAAAVVMTAPPMALFLAGQKYLLGEVWGRAKGYQGQRRAEANSLKTGGE